MLIFYALFISCLFPITFVESKINTKLTDITGSYKQSCQLSNALTSSQVRLVGQMTKSNQTPTTLSLKSAVKLGFYFFIWYALNIVYGVYNKKVLNVFPLPTTIAVVQLLIGIPLFLPIWFMNKPEVSINELKAISKIALLHGLGNIASVVSFGAGAVSFTHIVKAAEPVFTAAFSAIFLGSVLPLPVYACLILIIFGVSLASLGELSFTWLSFNSAMIGNACYQLRVVLAKKELASNSKSNLSAETLFRIMTLISTFQLIPLALLIEGQKIIPAWNRAILAGVSPQALLSNILFSGLSYYIYNEVSFWILAEVHPITHAVGNCIKRVVVIIASVFLFNTKLTTNGIIGSSIAVLGTFLYTIAQLPARGDKATTPSVK